MPKVSGPLEQIDELKGIGILLLLLFHAGGVMLWQNFLHGDLGTDIFFLISGICLAVSATDMECRVFFRRRLLRILPAYWIVLTAYVVLNQYFLQHAYSAPNLVAHYLGVHALFGDQWGFAINDTFWFITAILLFYAGFILLRSLLARADIFLLAAAVISTGGALLLFFLDQSGLTGRWGFRLIDFFLGMLVGQALRTGKLEIPLTPVLGAALLILLYIPYTRGIIFHPGVVALGVMGAYCLTIRPWVSQTAGWAPLKGMLNWLGRHSLEIFLIHQPLMREYNRYLYGRWFQNVTPSDFDLIVGMAIALAATLLLASELHRFTSWLIRRLPGQSASKTNEKMAMAATQAGNETTGPGFN